MKRKDFSVVIAIVFLSGLVSFFISGALFNKSKTKKEEVEVVQAINADFPEPSKKYFNPESINPTRQITIGDTTNPGPFQGN